MRGSQLTKAAYSLVAVLLLVLLASYPSSAYQQQTSGGKWEYKAMVVNGRIIPIQEGAPGDHSIQQQLNELGEDRWELVDVEQGYAYLKRRK